MGSSKSKRVFILLIAMSIVVGAFKFYELSAPMFEVCMGDAVVGYVLDKKVAKECYKDVNNEIKERLNIDDRVIKENLKYKRISDNLLESTYKEMKKNIMKTATNQVTLTKIMIDGKNYGYIANEKEGEKLLRKVADIYSDKLAINKKNIEKINICGDIKYKKVNSDVSALDDINTLAEKIVCEKKSPLDVDLIVRDKRKVEIQPDSQIKGTNDLYLGQSKVLEGKKGLKEQEIKTTYRNGKKQNVKVISENIITNSKSKIVYKGTKSPITNEMAFLQHPTRGGIVTSSFGSRWGKNHNGMDIGKNIGEPVLAALDGKVKTTFYEKDGYGNAIIIEHDGNLETRYAHLSSIDVKEGQKVKKGDSIGKVGNTGRSTGPHLHFELRENGSPVDPSKYIK